MSSSLWFKHCPIMIPKFQKSQPSSQLYEFLELLTYITYCVN